MEQLRKKKKAIDTYEKTTLSVCWHRILFICFRRIFALAMHACYVLPIAVSFPGVVIISSPVGLGHKYLRLSGARADYDRAASVSQVHQPGISGWCRYLRNVRCWSS